MSSIDNKTLVKEHLPCSNCDSTDALSEYKDGHTHCFSCGKTVFPSYELPAEHLNEIPSLKITPLPTEFKNLSDRGISKDTAKRYLVRSWDDTDNKLHTYPYFDRDGNHVANKARYKGKSFSVEGNINRAGLFGQNLFPPGSAKSITVVEGECDALAAYEMFGSKYPVVSVKSASQALKDCTEAFEFLSSFEQIVLAFDKDEGKVSPQGVRYPGQEAAMAVASLPFKPGQIRILTFNKYKDANDYLINGKAKDYCDEWWKAPVYTPSGLKFGSGMWEEISKPRDYETSPYPWEGLNWSTYGIRLSEMVVVTAHTKVGKTSFIKEIEHFLLSTTKTSVGFIHLEEPNQDTCLGLMSITANKQLHLPDVRKEVGNEELRTYYDTIVNNERVVIWDHFGSNTIHEVLAKIRHMAALGCKYIVLDHLSIIVSDQSGDERKQLDEIATKIKTLCMELNIAVIAVIHQNRNNQIRGTAGVEQLANIVIKLHRELEDPNEWRRNVTTVSVQANRFCGRTGPVCYLLWDTCTGRMVELNHEDKQKYLDGGIGSEVYIG